MDFLRYKNRLLEYLSLKGIKARDGLNFCFNPSHHNINTEACQIGENHFHCYSCGIDGDIYDAVGILEGITERAEQFKHLEKIFGAAPAPLPPEKTKPDTFTTDPASERELETWLASYPDAEKHISAYLSQRAKLKTPSSASYPSGVQLSLVKVFFYWPGFKRARKEFDHDRPPAASALFKCGIPFENQKLGFSSWEHDGVIVKLGRGYKLLYIDSYGASQKRGSKGCSTFPMPGEWDEFSSPILVEGEMDALACRAAGFKDVFSAGGTNGITGPKIKQYLLHCPQVTVMFDNDEPGHKAAGIQPYTDKDRSQTTLPEKLRSNGYTGSIFIARLDGPYKDSDAAICNGRRDLVQYALEHAEPYPDPAQEQNAAGGTSADEEPPEETETVTVTAGNKAVGAADDEQSEEVSAEKAAETDAGKLPANGQQVAKKKASKKTDSAARQSADMRGTLTGKDLKNLLKKIPRSFIEAADVGKFVGACMSAVPSVTSDIWKILSEWGAPQDTLNKPQKIKASYLITIANKLGLSYYYVNKLRNATVSKAELEQMAEAYDEPIVAIDFSYLKENKAAANNLYNWVWKKDEKSAANVVAVTVKNYFIYVKSDNEYYKYNGHVWQEEPDPYGVVYNVLTAVCRHEIGVCKEDDTDRLSMLKKCLSKLGQYKTLNCIVNLLKNMPGIFYKQVLFDSPKIKETLTLLDSVMDFSGKKIKFRAATQEEFRMATLPYTADQVINGTEPKNFERFMRDNFKDRDTLNTLLYYLSLIPSRCTTYKYGGIFIGPTHTGKTTTIELIGKIYTGMMVRFPTDLIMTYGKHAVTSNFGPNPYIARLEGKGVMVAQETERAGYLNGSLWKELTGGDTLTARGMYSQPRDFTPTAQVIIASNFSPRFDGQDQAMIDRMVVIPFNVQHEKGADNTRDADDITSSIEPEYPSIVRLFAEKYIELKYTYHRKIPLSKECQISKDDYVEKQESDLHKFVDANVEFVKDNKTYETLSALYLRYLDFCGIAYDSSGRPEDKDALTQAKFTRCIKEDWQEFRHNIKQKRINGYPVQIVLNMKLKPAVVDQEKNDTAADSQTQQPQQNEQHPDSIPDDDNPWQ